MNTIEFLQISSAVVPDREALVEVGNSGKRILYGEMLTSVVKLANALTDLGMERGQKIGVMSVNSADYVITYYACAMIGVTFVPLNYRAKDEELSYMLNASQSIALFVSDRYQSLVERIRPSLVHTQHFISYDFQADGYLGYDDLTVSASEDEPWVDVDDHDATAIIFTSGTTAMPKGVQLTYLDLTAYVTNTMSPADPEIHDKTLVSAPFFHVAGVTALMSSIWGGRTLLILPVFTPELWLEAVDREGATHSFVVPTMLKRVMEVADLDKYDLSRLKLITYGAAPMPYEVVRKACDVFPPKGVGLMNAYGQTESTSTLTFLAPDDHDLSVDTAVREKRLRSVGRPMDDVEIGIMNDDNARLADGKEGEICVKSDRVMKGYYAQEDATSSAIIDGWLHTGDVGYVDESGYLFITGRKKDLIIRGGENISAGEIEACLTSHPAVEEAAVIGVYDADWGEAVKAVIVFKPGASASAADIQEYCKGRLASYKTPAWVAALPELPRNAMGKVVKNDLRKMVGQPQHDNVT